MKQLTKTFNQILETKKIPAEWKEAKMIILHKKGDMRDIKLYRPTCTSCSHGYYKKEWKGIWMKTNQENRLVSEKVTQMLTISKLIS